LVGSPQILVCHKAINHSWHFKRSALCQLLRKAVGKPQEVLFLKDRENVKLKQQTMIKMLGILLQSDCVGKKFETKHTKRSATPGFK